MCIVGNTRKAGDLWIKSTRTTVSLKKKKKNIKAPEQEMVQFIKPLSKIKVTKRGPWEGFKFYTPRRLSRGRLFFL